MGSHQTIKKTVFMSGIQTTFPDAERMARKEGVPLPTTEDANAVKRKLFGKYLWNKDGNVVNPHEDVTFVIHANHRCNAEVILISDKRK